jgi:uncharacterized membrane protein
MRDSHDEVGRRSKELVRLEAFSDGVFAIAITLLILEVIQGLHTGQGQKLTQLLLMNWKSILVFLVGFLTILICWINHHQVLSFAEKTDSNFFWVNGFVLLVVTFTPFPTAILAEYFESDSHVAMAVFGFNYFLMSVAAYCVTGYIYRKLAPREKSGLLKYYKRLYLYSILFTLAAFFVCFFSAAISLFFYSILFIVFAFPREFALRLEQRNKRKKKRVKKIRREVEEETS